jgi:hypothetical protein
MEVYFASTPTTGNGKAFHKIGRTQVVFNKGVYKTTDKEQVIDIMSSEIFRRGEVLLVSDAELVDNYLGGEEPEYFDLELLSKISDEGLKVLAREYRTKNQIHPNIIKAELHRQPVSDTALKIIEAHPMKPKGMTDEDKRGYVDGLVDSGSIIKAGPWYTRGEFKTRSYLEMYDHIIEQRESK